jgi:tetratricopeptide (TPR) repeat protein
MFSWLMVVGKDTRTTLNYFYNNPTLVQFYKNQGNGNFYYCLGNIYFYTARYDSALYYYRKAKDELNLNYDNSVRISIFESLAESCEKTGEMGEAKNYYEKTLELCKQINATESISRICNTLSKLYAGQSDFKSAYYYDQQADSCNEILEANAARDKVVLLQVDMENKKHENDLMETQVKKDRQDNLQLMAITFCLAVVFSIMFFMGLFKVSPVGIKLLGYFAFISLFEFIVLLIDPFIVKLTDGEPLKIWGIKIFLIAMLVPFQHFLESGLVKFLSSKKLTKTRKKFSFRSRPKKKKNIPGDSTDIEKDTAVL